MTLNELVAKISHMYGGDSVASEWDAENGKPTEMPASGDPMARMLVLMAKGSWDKDDSDRKNLDRLADMAQMGASALEEITEELRKLNIDIGEGFHGDQPQDIAQSSGELRSRPPLGDVVRHVRDREE